MQRVEEAVVVAARRTPIGKFLGQFRSTTAVQLGIAATRAVVSDAGLAPDEVAELYFGNGRQAGAGPNPGRQIAIGAGLSESTVASTINQACASGLKTIILGATDIWTGRARVVVAGGTESMTGLPFLLPNARLGYRLGHAKMVDAMYQDGFVCPMAEMVMGETAENLAREYSIDRAAQDAYAVGSQDRAHAALEAGRFADEITPVEVPDRKKGTVTYDADEHPRPGVTVEKLGRLPLAFPDADGNGTIHAGNASGITDGAAAVVLMAASEAEKRGLEPLARVEAHASAGVDPRLMGIGPVPCCERLAAETGRAAAEHDLVELNEAFAAQVLACQARMHIPEDRLNVNGGAIALGHPIGATGTRIVVTLLHEMRRRGAGTGLATLCVSGGLGVGISFVRETSS